MIAPKKTAPTLMATISRYLCASRLPVSVAPVIPESALKKPRYVGALSSTLESPPVPQ